MLCIMQREEVYLVGSCQIGMTMRCTALKDALLVPRLFDFGCAHLLWPRGFNLNVHRAGTRSSQDSGRGQDCANAVAGTPFAPAHAAPSPANIAGSTFFASGAERAGSAAGNGSGNGSGSGSGSGSWARSGQSTHLAAHTPWLASSAQGGLKRSMCVTISSG